jgi:hypothetical protein
VNRLLEDLRQSNRLIVVETSQARTGKVRIVEYDPCYIIVEEEGTLIIIPTDKIERVLIVCEDNKEI